MFFNQDEECHSQRERSDSFASKLLKTRTIVLAGEVDQDVAERIISQLLVLDSESHDPIRMIITSNGGHVESGMAIHDMMKFVESDVIAIGAGWVVSIAVPILLGAKKNHRFALPNTRFMIHQPLGGVGGQATDVRIAAQEIVKIRETITHLIADESGQPLDKVAADSDRNFWLTAPEAVEYGLVTKIIQSSKEAA